MEFYIKKNATLPILKLQVVKNGRLDYNNFMSLMEQSAFFFSMTDVETGVGKIVSRPAGFVEKTNVDPNADPEYYLYYQFQNRDTNRVGRYEGQFMLRNSDGVLILPIREKLYINVQESFIADDLEYNSCYTSEFPCCINGPFTTTTTTTPCPSCTPCVTTTTTIPFTTTTTTVIPPVELILNAVITPGSVNINYILTSSEILTDNLSLSFTNILGQIIGTGITVNETLTINSGSNVGIDTIITNDDYFNLDKTSIFTNININYPLSITFDITVNTIFPPLPTIQLINPIITEETNIYIKVGMDEYLKYINLNN
jgi:hypothetical protein